MCADAAAAAQIMIAAQAGCIDALKTQATKLRAEICELKECAIFQRAQVDAYRNAAPKDVPPYISVHKRVSEKIAEAYNEADAENKLLRATIITLQEQLLHYERERGPGHC